MRRDTMRTALRGAPAIAVMLLATRVGAQSRSVEEVRGPSDQARTAADSLWRPIEMIMQSLGHPDAATLGPADRALRERNPNLERFTRTWSEVSCRILRELGFTFYDRFPDDPRRLSWLQATLRNSGGVIEMEPVIQRLLSGSSAAGRSN